MGRGPTARGTGLQEGTGLAQAICSGGSQRKLLYESSWKCFKVLTAPFTNAGFGPKPIKRLIWSICLMERWKDAEVLHVCKQAAWNFDGRDAPFHHCFVCPCVPNCVPFLQCPPPVILKRLENDAKGCGTAVLGTSLGPNSISRARRERPLIEALERRWQGVKLSGSSSSNSRINSLRQCHRLPKLRASQTTKCWYP